VEYNKHKIISRLRWEKYSKDLDEVDIFIVFFKLLVNIFYFKYMQTKLSMSRKDKKKAHRSKQLASFKI